MGKIIVIGHKNPDTDSVAAAIGLAELLKKEGKEAIPVRGGNLNKETEWALNHSGLEIGNVENIEGDEYFFVDFNEESQSPVDLKKVKLAGLLDHHKLACSWSTEDQVLFRVEPIGSTSTLVAKLYKERGEAIDAPISKALLCGIISDTLNFTSPTTTEEDKKYAEELAGSTQENTNELADKLFEAKSDLSSFTPEEIAKLDYKVFEFNGKKVGIGVIETVNPANAKEMEKDLREAVLKMKESENLDLVYLGIVDILKQETELILVGEEEKKTALKAFPDSQAKGDNLVLKEVVSRKKQIAPAIERALK